MADYRGLGFDPVPGNAEHVAAAAERMRRAARLAANDTVGSAERRTHGWEGQAADACRNTLREITAEAQESARVLAHGSDVLSDWASVLIGNQRQAHALDKQAREIRRDLSGADDRLGRAELELRLATGPSAADAQIRHEQALADVQQLTTRLEDVLRRARELSDDHRHAAARVTERLQALAAGNVTAADAVPTRDELYGAVAAAVTGQSEITRGIAGAVFGYRRSTLTEPVPVGGAAAFAAAVAGQ